MLVVFKHNSLVMEHTSLSEIPGVHAGSSLYHVNDGFFFVVSRRTAMTVYFRCHKRGSGCRATAILNSGYFQSSMLHNHAADPLHVPLTLERARLVNEASSLDYPTFGDIFRSTRNLFPEILTPHSLQPAMARRWLDSLPDKPSTLRDLDLILRDERYTNLSATSGCADNIYAGSTLSQDDTLVILFMTSACKEFMKLSTVLFGVTMLFNMVGAPHQYVVHVICTVWDKTFIILAWFFLERISEQSFIAAFSHLKNLLEWSHIQTIVCQQGSKEAIAYKSVFEPVRVTFSLHNFVEIVGNFIISDIPNYDSCLVDLACLFCALPILPSDFLCVGLNAVREEILRFQGVQEHAHILLNYIQSSWISVMSDFSFCGDHNRTSNVQESVKRKVNQMLDAHKNNIYSLVRDIASVSEKTQRDIEDIKCADMTRRRSRCVQSLADVKEIQVLTQALIQPFGSQSAAALNLLNVASLRIRHLLNHLCVENIAPVN